MAVGDTGKEWCRDGSSEVLWDGRSGGIDLLPYRFLHGMVVRVLEDGTPDLGSPSSEIRFSCSFSLPVDKPIITTAYTV